MHRPIFNATVTPQRWLTSSNRTHTIAAATLRSQLSWSTARVPTVKAPPEYLRFGELESIITGQIGDMLTNGAAHFGNLHGRAVEVSWLAVDAMLVDLDLSVNALEQPEADVDFDIRLVCEANRLVFRVENITLEVDPSWYQPLSLMVFALYTPPVPELRSPTLATPYCPTFVVSDGLDGAPGWITFR